MMKMPIFSSLSQAVTRIFVLSVAFALVPGKSDPFCFVPTNQSDTPPRPETRSQLPPLGSPNSIPCKIENVCDVSSCWFGFDYSLFGCNCKCWDPCRTKVCNVTQVCVPTRTFNNLFYGGCVTKPAICPKSYCGRPGCTYGYELDSKGCETCECKDPCKNFGCPRSSTCQMLPSLTNSSVLEPQCVVCPKLENCSKTGVCPRGLAKDPITGCDVCECHGCPCIKQCTDVYCLDYKAMNSISGCDRCACESVNCESKCSNDETCMKKYTIQGRIYGVCETKFKCPESNCYGSNCPYGPKTDSNGCLLSDCSCYHPCDRQQCELGFYCDMTPDDCTGSYCRDAPMPYCRDCPSTSNCSLNASQCPNGLDRDEHGCMKCVCKGCPSLPCNLICKYGSAVNKTTGCQICSCKSSPCVYNSCPFQDCFEVENPDGTYYAQCKPKTTRPACPTVDCNAVSCFMGLEIDEYGCRRPDCACFDWCKGYQCESGMRCELYNDCPSYSNSCRDRYMRRCVGDVNSTTTATTTTTSATTTPTTITVTTTPTTITVTTTTTTNAPTTTSILIVPTTTSSTTSSTTTTSTTTIPTTTTTSTTTIPTTTTTTLTTAIPATSTTTIPATTTTTSTTTIPTTTTTTSTTTIPATSTTTVPVPTATTTTTTPTSRTTFDRGAQCPSLTCTDGCQIVLDPNTNCPVCNCPPVDRCQTHKCPPGQVCVMTRDECNEVIGCRDAPMPVCIGMPSITATTPPAVMCTAPMCHDPCFIATSPDRICPYCKCPSNCTGATCGEDKDCKMVSHSNCYSPCPKIPYCVKKQPSYCSFDKDEGESCWDVPVLQWFYNEVEEMCDVFHYNGCRGNKNRFPTLASCESTCKSQSYACPDFYCPLDCTFGFRVDSNGCKLCSCMDLCEDIVCQSPNQICRNNTMPCPSDTIGLSDLSEGGIEIPRCPRTSTVNCICNPPKCNVICPFGKMKDAYDCETCQCRDPCQNVVCGVGQLCLIVEYQNCDKKSCLSTLSGQCINAFMKRNIRIRINASYDVYVLDKLDELTRQLTTQLSSKYRVPRSMVMIKQYERGSIVMSADVLYGSEDQYNHVIDTQRDFLVTLDNKTFEASVVSSEREMPQGGDPGKRDVYLTRGEIILIVLLCVLLPIIVVVTVVIIYFAYLKYKKNRMTILKGPFMHASSDLSILNDESSLSSSSTSTIKSDDMYKTEKEESHVTINGRPFSFTAA